MEILVLFHSRYGTVYRLAKEIASGINDVQGVQARVRRSREVAPIEIIRSNPRWSAMYDKLEREVPEVSLSDLAETQGIALGSPTRYGNIEPSLGNFLETVGELWTKGSLLGKVGGVFCSTGTMHGGNETTLITMMLPLMHLGYIIMPLSYCDPGVSFTERGGTPYGPSCVAGTNDDKGPDDIELALCRIFGRRLAETTKHLHK